MTTSVAPQELTTVTSEAKPGGMPLIQENVPPKVGGQVTSRVQRQLFGKLTAFALVEIAPAVESPLPLKTAPLPRLMAPSAIIVP